MINNLEKSILILSVDFVLKQPNLYILVVEIKDLSGKVIDCESCQVGIRHISHAHKQLLINGNPVIIRGVNRHEHHPRIGKTNSEACMVQVLIHSFHGFNNNIISPLIQILG